MVMAFLFQHLFVLICVLRSNRIVALDTNVREREAGQPKTKGLAAKQTLYFLAIQPYLDPEPILHPRNTFGLDIFPAVQLAVDHVNNKTDVLRDYHIEVIKTDGGCEVTSKALIAVFSQLFHGEKKIAGIIGPLCSDSAMVTGPITGRREIALVNIHLGSSPLLSDRVTYPYSIGLALPPKTFITAYVDLMKQAKWTRIALLYNIETLVDYTLFKLMREDARAAGIEIVYAELVSENFIPYKELRETYARVIIPLVRRELAFKIMCVAYHNNMIHPTHQWIVYSHYEPRDISFYYEPDNREYSCTTKELREAFKSNVDIFIDFPKDPNYDDVITVSGLPVKNIIEAYYERWELFNNATYVFDEFPRIYSFLGYDSVWVMALALNASLATLQEKNISLANYTYGQSNVSKVILENLLQLEFNGLSGMYSFDNQTGYAHYVYTYEHYYPLVENSFEVVYLKVRTGIATMALLVITVTSVLVAFLHILNTLYEKYKTIKASSSRLNHFAYVGCYCMLLVLLMYTIVESFIISSSVVTLLCNFIPWLASIGFSLVFGTVIVKTWRLYKIFFSSTRHKKHVRMLNKDAFLAVFVAVLVVVDVLLCTVWSAVDPLQYGNETHINTDRARREVEETCSSEWLTVWLGLLVVYKGMQLLFAVFLSFMTRKIRIKEFKTTNITLLVYLLFLVTGLGIPVYFITWQLGVDVNISYTLICVVVAALVYLCWGFLFLPPVIPLLREKKGFLFCQGKN